MAKIVKTGLFWMLFLGAALFILSGRYSWEPSSLPYSRRGFLDSAYMLVFTLPTVYYLLRKFVRVRFVPEVLVLILAIILVLPYHWLGLEKYQYTPFYSYPWEGVDASKFPAFAQDFPAGIRQLGQVIPFLFPFLAFLIILGLISAIFCTYYKTESLFINRPIELFFWLGLFVLVILQTWIHLSYHSPILASTLIDRTKLSGWYAVPLFPDNKGIMMADYHLWRDLEAYFMGLPINPQDEFIRRSYLFYLTSQFSYFISPYYVYITRNILLWFGSSGAMFLLAKRITSQTGSAIFTALLTTVGSGFILYSTEAPDNLAGYAVIPIILLIFIKFIDAERQTIGDYILFGCFLGLASLVYDIFPWYLAIPGIAWIMKKPMKKVILSLGISGLIYAGFLLLQARVFGINLSNRNSDFITSSLANIFKYVIHFHIKLLYTLTLRGFDLYFYTLAAAFLVLPLFLAGAGLALIRERKIFLLLLTFWAIPFLTFVALLYGNQNWLEAPLVALPRLHYTNFLWVYIAAGFCLNGIREKLKAGKLEFLAYAIPIVIILIIFLLNNADVFGWHQLYSVID
ncbi:MAG: hypothetical protein ABSB41_09860 [Anaerolineales bacterium]